MSSFFDRRQAPRSPGLGRVFLRCALAFGIPAALIGACAAVSDNSFVGEVGGGSSSAAGGGAACAAGTFVCDGNVAKACDGKGGYAAPVDCGSRVCAPGLGCVDCIPSTATCEAGKAKTCDAQGKVESEYECDPVQGMECKPNGCTGACSPSALGTSYLGCEYWPTVTANGVWTNFFNFAVALASTTTEITSVVIEGPNGFMQTVDIPPNQAEVVQLPWVASLKGPDADLIGTGVPITANQRGGAYRVRANHPLAVYQFSPLDYQNVNNPPGCPNLGTFGCYSYSNDASLLLPTNALTASYYVVGWRTVFSGDFLSITATQDDTKVVLTTGPKAKTLPGEGVDLGPNKTATILLKQGEVIELFTEGKYTSQQWSGSTVTANHPVQVITGSPCATVPDATPACDHIEESVLPAEALGSTYAVTVPRTPNGAPNTPNGGRHAVRIHGVGAGAKLKFDPPSISTKTSIKKNEVIEIQGVVDDFVVTGDAPFAVTQYMYGQGDPIKKDNGVGAGDPSQSIAIPIEQYRKDYAFIAPTTYETSFVNIVAPTGASIELDGITVDPSSFSAIGASKNSVARVMLQPLTLHHIKSDQAFGIVVYAYGQYTSYMYPGGMDLKKISPPVPE